MMDGGRPERHCPHRPSRGKKRRSSDSSLAPQSLHRASERASDVLTHEAFLVECCRSRQNLPQRQRTRTAAAAAAQAPIRMATTDGDGELSVERSGNGANAGEEKSSVNPTAAAVADSWVGERTDGRGGKNASFRKRSQPSSLPHPLTMSSLSPQIKNGWEPRNRRAFR